MPMAITAQWSTAMPNRTDQGRLSILLDARSRISGYALVDGLPDRDQRISNLLAPGYVVAAAGYAPKPERHRCSSPRSRASSPSSSTTASQPPAPLVFCPESGSAWSRWLHPMEPDVAVDGECE